MRSSKSLKTNKPLIAIKPIIFGASLSRGVKQVVTNQVDLSRKYKPLNAPQ